MTWLCRRRHTPFRRIDPDLRAKLVFRGNFHAPPMFLQARSGMALHSRVAGLARPAAASRLNQDKNTTMSWIRIQRTTKRSRDVATLSIGRRQRNGRVEHWVRLGLGEGILEQLALAPGDHVELFLGHDENQGKIALRKSEPRPECFRLTRYGAGACVAFSADLLGGGAPAVLEKKVLAHRLAEGRLELTLPQQPEAAARPAGPCTEAGEARAVALAATVSRAIRSVEPPCDRKPPAAQGGDAAAADRRGRYGAAWTAEDDAQLRQMRQAGLPAAAIAEALGRTSASIALRISKLQLPKGNGRAGQGHPACAGQREAPDSHNLSVTEALDWLRWNGEPVERLDGGSFCIAGERVTPHRLVQIANLRRARRSLPPLPLPASALLYPPRRPAAGPDHARQRDSA